MEMVRRTGAKVIIHEADAPGIADTPQFLLDMFGAEPQPPADILVSFTLRGWFSRATRFSSALSEEPICRAHPIRTWSNRSGPSSMLFPAKRWSFPATTMGCIRHPPSNRNAEPMPLSAANRRLETGCGLIGNCLRRPFGSDFGGAVYLTFRPPHRV